MADLTTDVAAGGIFLTSHDPKRLIAWFNDALAIPMVGDEAGGMVLLPGGDHPCVLSVQPASDDAPKPPRGAVEAEPYGRQTMMCNLRVQDLGAVVERLQAGGYGVAGPREYEGMGHFAWTRTPDGHDIELWQPAQ